MKHVISAVLFVCGTVLCFWGGFCLLGGPDGAVLSRASFEYGVPVMLVAALLLYLAKALSNAGMYVFVPIAVTVLAWLLAALGMQRIGFYFWLYGVPVAFLFVVVSYAGGWRSSTSGM